MTFANKYHCTTKAIFAAVVLISLCAIPPAKAQDRATQPDNGKEIRISLATVKMNCGRLMLDTKNVNGGVRAVRKAFDYDRMNLAKNSSSTDAMLIYTEGQSELSEQSRVNCHRAIQDLSNAIYGKLPSPPSTSSSVLTPDEKAVFDRLYPGQAEP